ncbi:MAG: DNA replication/repair protein RecF, partial [Acidimicrobiales bacterium]
AGEPVTLRYECSWAGPLADALAAARRDDLRRGVSTVGPHRDDLVLGLGGRDARTQASQGQQRCLALSLRLAVHRLVTTETTSAPLLLLDDVFSELDPERSRALVRSLPDGPALLTTAVPLPGGVEVAKVVAVG